MHKFFKLFVCTISCLGIATAPIPRDVLIAVDDRVPAGSGAFPALMEQASSLPDQTIYVPAVVNRGTKLPVVLWGNGGCMAFGNRYRLLLTELASHGYLVIALGGIGPRTIESGSQAGMPPPPKHMEDPRQSSYTQMLDALRWATAQNANRKSPLFGKVDTQAIATMGHSCGGLQAIAAAADPRIKTSVILNSGIWSNGVGGPPSAPVTKSSLAKLHGSVLYLSGDASDIAHENSGDDFRRLSGLPAVWAYRNGVDHGGTYFEPGGGIYGSVLIHWLQWRLKGDRKAASLFAGDTCGLCRDSHWHIARKNVH